MKHVQTGMCIHVTRLLQTDEYWGNLSFVELSNNCLDPAGQFRFLDNGAMLNLERKGCLEATSREGHGYGLDMLYMLLTPDPIDNCAQRHAITQISWRGLYVLYIVDRPWCVVPETDSRILKDQGIDRYIGMTSNCITIPRINVLILVSSFYYAVNLFDVFPHNKFLSMVLQSAFHITY